MPKVFPFIFVSKNFFCFAANLLNYGLKCMTRFALTDWRIAQPIITHFDEILSDEFFFMRTIFFVCIFACLSLFL